MDQVTNGRQPPDLRMHEVSDVVDGQHGSVDHQRDAEQKHRKSREIVRCASDQRECDGRCRDHGEPERKLRQRRLRKLSPDPDAGDIDSGRYQRRNDCEGQRLCPRRRQSVGARTHEHSNTRRFRAVTGKRQQCEVAFIALCRRKVAPGHR